MFTDIEREVVARIREDWVKTNLTDDGRDRVLSYLTEWLAGTRKKQVPDLNQRMEAFRKRIEVLARTFDLTIERGQFVVKASGEAESTLRMLERGTDWFDPIGDVAVLVIGAVFE